MNSVVLDASAVLAFLHRERGMEVVERHLAGAMISAVNYSEVLKKAIENGGVRADAEAAIGRLQLTIIPFDQPAAAQAAALWNKARKWGLSFADRSCLALGLRVQRSILTADKRWAELDLGIKIRMIR